MLLNPYMEIVTIEVVCSIDNRGEPVPIGPVQVTCEHGYGLGLLHLEIRYGSGYTDWMGQLN